MRIRYLYFADCPSHGEGLERLRKVLREEALEADLEILEVTTDEQARRLNFIGSPTILIDGRDVDPVGLEGQPAGLTCQVYRYPDGRFSPLPSEEMLRSALRLVRA